MRLTGWVLLLIGGLLCATISWAALGFLLMGIGLISLQVAERRRRREDRAVPAGTTGFTPPRLSPGLQPPTLDPVAGQDTGPQRQPRRVAWPDKKGEAPYDRQAWRRLVESDPDLAQIAKVLSDYGPQYVDELATSYLAAPDKSRLSAIVDGIIARARGGQPAPPPAPVEGSRPPPLPPRPEPQAPAPAAKPTASPSNPADALEASLLATVEEATARIAAERAGLFKPAKDKASDSRSSTASQREPLFGRAPRDAKPAEPPPMPAARPAMPMETSANLEASPIAAVSEAATRRADTTSPAAAKTAPAKTAADNLDETLLAALAEISGQKLKGESKPDAASKDPPADDGLSDMVKKFAPDSNFLRKQ
ncbi:hypothetical protein JQ559_14915 [Bradyrhizobium viridifuturi]|uniref:hypothetical protein n=1 Tax=Bradyrhizobium TaxID=374 RepID=UPI000397DDCD|nr:MULTISPECIES: hypothetical protein [Bradyrhizobium]ERF84056.1 MAG: hypothetical protein C207_02843 [Bradyrhizobium sp. DFCI-1]QRI69134.1 hypothetical protein JQ507_30355 [Bradyrhizobium sp. PSBB068]MBR1019279.1 hypothetical protein [Bradyrhizobium viridifuturi]MBR1037088.1 hypothetical protein [Bradyrhizobium viridifuturi]MBR1044945.1 hypothetical protein [Bradyrhizobium viridifuturi]